MPTTRKPAASLENIARAAGVSKMTVSRVLRDGAGFSEETRARVLREAALQNYLPNRLAAAFGSAASSTLVGICIPRFTSTLFGQLLESLNANLTRLGYQTMIGSHGERPQDAELWLQGLASWRPAGVIMTGRHHTKGTLDLLRNLTIPVIEIWDLTTNPIDVSVGFSHFDNGQEMGRHLAAKGRTRIAYVGAFAGVEAMGHTRRKGFANGLAEAGLSLVATEVLHDQSGFYAGYYGTETVLGRRRDIDAIYYHNDEMAIGGMAYLAKRGIRVPDDIGVAGWGGMEAASILPLRLTTTDVPCARIGKIAAEALVGRIRSEPVTDVNHVPTLMVPGATI